MFRRNYPIFFRFDQNLQVIRYPETQEFKVKLADYEERFQRVHRIFSKVVKRCRYICEIEAKWIAGKATDAEKKRMQDEVASAKHTLSHRNLARQLIKLAELADELLEMTKEIRKESPTSCVDAPLPFEPHEKAGIKFSFS